MFRADSGGQARAAAQTAEGRWPTSWSVNDLSVVSARAVGLTIPYS